MQRSRSKIWLGAALAAGAALGAATYSGCASAEDSEPTATTTTTSAAGGAGGQGGAPGGSGGLGGSGGSGASGGEGTAGAGCGAPTTVCEEACQLQLACLGIACEEGCSFFGPLKCGEPTENECIAQCALDVQCDFFGASPPSAQKVACIAACGVGSIPECKSCVAKNCDAYWNCSGDDACQDWYSCFLNCSDAACVVACDAQFDSATVQDEPTKECMFGPCVTECAPVAEVYLGGSGGSGGSGGAGGS